MDPIVLALIIQLVTLLVVFLAVAGFIWLIMRLLPASVRRFLNFSFTDPSANRPPESGDQSDRIKRMQSDLVSLVGGNTAKARKLLDEERRIRPGMSNGWYLEKIIDDIRRGN